jgi:hypothetical protein
MTILNIKYKTFDHFSEVPAPQLPQLKRLSNGGDGVMWFMVDDFQNGYVTLLPRNIIQYNQKIDELNRHIVIAYVNRQPVGWCATDDEGMVSFYVAKKYRKLEIGLHLAKLWVVRNTQVVKRHKKNQSFHELCYTDDAVALVDTAAKQLGLYKNTKRKYRQIVHHLPE